MKILKSITNVISAGLSYLYPINYFTGDQKEMGLPITDPTPPPVHPEVFNDSYRFARLYQADATLHFDDDFHEYVLTYNYKGKGYSVRAHTREALDNKLADAKVKAKNGEFVSIDCWKIEDFTNRIMTVKLASGDTLTIDSRKTEDVEKLTDLEESWKLVKQDYPMELEYKYRDSNGVMHSAPSVEKISNVIAPYIARS